MNKFTIALKDLEALSIAMSSEVGRYYLNGIHVKRVAVGYRLAATDGNMLLCATVKENTESAPECDVIIRDTFVKNAIKMAKSLKMRNLTIGVDGKDSHLFDHDNIIMSGWLIDGTYPNIERVLPDNKDPDSNKKYAISGVNATRLAKVSKLVTSNKSQDFDYELFGTCFCISFGDRSDFVGLCMGYKADHSRYNLYSTVKNNLQPHE